MEWEAVDELVAADARMAQAQAMDPQARQEKLTPRQTIRLGFWDRFLEAVNEKS